MILDYMKENDTVGVTIVEAGNKTTVRIPIYVIVDKQKFKNPNTGNMVKYTSLPSEARELVKKKIKKDIANLDKASKKKIIAKYRRMKKKRASITEKKAKEQTTETPKKETIENQEEKKEEPTLKKEDFKNSEKPTKEIPRKYKEEIPEDRQEKIEEPELIKEDFNKVSPPIKPEEKEIDDEETKEHTLTKKDFTPNINKETHLHNREAIEKEYEGQVSDHRKQMEKLINEAPTEKEKEKRKGELNKYLSIAENEKNKKLKESASTIKDPIERYEALVSIEEEHTGEEMSPEDKIKMVKDLYTKNLRKASEEEKEQLKEEQKTIINKINKDYDIPTEDDVDEDENSYERALTKKDKQDLQRIAKEAKYKVPTNPKERSKYFLKELNAWKEDYKNRLKTGDVHDAASENLKLMARMGISPEEYEKNKERFEKQSNKEFKLGHLDSMLSFISTFFEFLKG